MTGLAPTAAGRPHARRLGHRDVVVIAAPIMLSNATTPLVGYVDTMVIGQLGQAALIGGVGVAANIFSFLYWLFAFLRMGTTGLTAQAEGAGDATEVLATLARAVLIAVSIGVVIIAAQHAIAWGAFRFMGASPAVEAAARTYFDIRIWATPAGLVNFALVGWFIGLGKAHVAFWLQLLLNAINLVLAYVLVAGFGLAIAGVGYAVLVAEVVAALAGLAAARAVLRGRDLSPSLAGILDIPALTRMLLVNRDIMIRTFCLLFAMSFFVAQGARTGDTTLAANHVLMSIIMIAIFLLDGFAFAAETLVGQAVGGRDRVRGRRAALLTTVWAGVLGLVLSLVIWVVGPLLIDLTARDPAVRELARHYLPWAALAPIVGVWCFQLDGIFIGATRTADMRNMMALSLIVYLVMWAALFPSLANHGLWIALLVMFAARGVLLALRYPALERSVYRHG